MEFWTIYYGKVDRNKRATGQLTDSDVAELQELLETEKRKEEEENGAGHTCKD